MMKWTTNGLVFNLFSERNCTVANGGWESALPVTFNFPSQVIPFKERSSCLTSHLTAIIPTDPLGACKGTLGHQMIPTHFPGAQRFCKAHITTSLPPKQSLLGTLLLAVCFQSLSGFAGSELSPPGCPGLSSCLWTLSSDQTILCTMPGAWPFLSLSFCWWWVWPRNPFFLPGSTDKY